MRKGVVGQRRLQQLAKKETQSIPKNTFTSTQVAIQPTSSSVLPQNNNQTRNDCNLEDNNVSSSESDSYDEECMHNSDSEHENSAADVKKVLFRPLIEEIKSWAIDYSIKHNQLTGLLKILRTHKCFESFPADSRTLVKPIKADVKCVEISPGKYIHFGLEQYIRQAKHVHPDKGTLKLQINIDGLQVFKSRGTTMWPILGYFCGLEFQPFVIGAYCGPEKPSSVSQYVQNLVQDINTSRQLGVSVQSFVCDAPAKAFLLGIKGHNGFFGCDKCDIKGKSISRRMSYYDVVDSNSTSTARTNLGFRSNLQPEHHISSTSLT